MPWRFLAFHYLVWSLLTALEAAAISLVDVMAIFYK